MGLKHGAPVARAGHDARLRTLDVRSLQAVNGARFSIWTVRYRSA
jgi:hypothetical protein